MSPYAQATKVPVDRSRAEIERTLIRFGASGFGYGWDSGKEQVGFTYQNKTVRMEVPMPPQPSSGATRASLDTYEKERRRRWRSLTMVVKAKVVGIEDRITTFEQEFLAYFVTPSGKTIGQLVIPQLDKAASEGRLPPLLEAPR